MRARASIGGNAIVGAGLPLAVGLALADKMQGRSRASCCVFGEGAVAEGAFHEALNLAALGRPPGPFLCENNSHAMGTAIEYEQLVDNIAWNTLIASPPPAPTAWTCSPSKPLHARRSRTSATAKDRICSSAAPIVSARTRCSTRSSIGPRPRWRNGRSAIQSRDLALHLKGAGLLTDADMEGVERDVAAEAQAAVDFAEAGTWEPVEDLTRFVHS